MELSAKVDNQPTLSLLTVRQKLPLWVFMIGAGISALAFGADLLGLSHLIAADGFLKTSLIRLGLAMMAFGAVADPNSTCA